jgi:hypothetical protein
MQAQDTKKGIFSNRETKKKKEIHKRFPNKLRQRADMKKPKE